MYLSEILRRTLTDRSGESLGRVADVVVRLRAVGPPLVIGLVARVGTRQVFVPVAHAASLEDRELALTSAMVDLHHFEPRQGEVLLHEDVLGHRLLDVVDARLVRAFDLELARRDGEWVLARIDVRRPRRLLAALTGHPGARTWRDVKAFEPLIGHTDSAPTRGPGAWISRLKAAHIADLLEDASDREQHEILGHLHAHPELEADVFEELDEDRATRLLGARTDGEIAEVLARMRADDAADAIGRLPQRRRRPVLDLLPPVTQAKVLTLLGFNRASAGGLMGMDFIALPAAASAGRALSEVRQARTLQPEALTSVHLVDDAGRLRGVATLVALVQAAPDAPLIEVGDTDPVRIGPDTDVVDVAVLMADHNLITIPVIDDDGRLLGVVTVDDVLETMLPRDWRRREPATMPDRGRRPDRAAAAVTPDPHTARENPGTR